MLPKSWVTTEKKADIWVTPLLKGNRVLIECEGERVRCKENSDNGEGEMSGKGYLSTHCFTMVVTLIKTWVYEPCLVICSQLRCLGMPSNFYLITLKKVRQTKESSLFIPHDKMQKAKHN